MKRQRAISTGSLSRLLQQAADAWRRMDYQVTIDLLERASRLDPANSRVLLDLARAYGLRYEYAASERCIEKAIRISPQRSEALAEAGRRCQEFGHEGMATAYLERAAKESSASPDALVTLAGIYERRSRLDDSAALIARALAVLPKYSRALLAQARLLRLAGELEKAEAATRAVLRESFCDPDTRIRACYELGGILDRQFRFDEAMLAFQEAKALQLPASKTAAAILEGVQSRVRELRQSVSRDVLGQWAAESTELGPPRRFALLCGHPRSGTTLLEQVLDAHPDIVTAEETHILHDEAYLPLARGFSEDTSVLQVLQAASPGQLRRSREDYFRFMQLFLQHPVASQLVIDKNPALNVLIPAVSRIFPEAKFIVALRDPRDICLSCFMQYLPLNPVSSAYLTIEGTVRQYLSVMGLWQTLQPRMRNPVMEVRYEDMVSGLDTVARRVLEFLGVEWDEAVLRFHEHARRKTVRSPSYADVTRPVYGGAVGRWRHYEKHLAPVLRELEPLITELGYSSGS